MKKTFLIIILVVIFAVVIFLLNKNKVPQGAEITASPEASPTPTAPMAESPSPTSSPRVSETFNIGITKDGISTKTLTIKAGDTIRFINNDDALHWPAAGPHPSHTICPGFDSLKGLKNGEIYSFTFTTVKECPFHDHLNAGNPNLSGKIIVTD